MRRNKFFFICLSLMIFFVVPACGAVQIKESVASENKSDIPVQYKKQLKCLKFDIEHIQMNRNHDLYQCTAKKLDFHPEIIARQFWGEHFQENIFENEDGVIFLEHESNTLYIDRSGIVYLSNSNLQSDMEEKLTFDKNGYVAKDIHSYTEFTEGSLSTEKKQLEKLLQDIGIPDLALKKCYDFEECTYWLGIQEWEETPVLTTVLYGGMNDEWMPVQIMNTQESVEKVRTSYCFEFRREEEKINLLSFDKIAEALDYEYSMILTDNKYKVVGAELYFWVDVNQEESEYRMEPVWLFTIQEDCDDFEKDDSVYQEMIHAETGKCVGVRR